MPVIRITDEIRTELLKPVEGEGGFQNLLRQMLGNLNGLELTLADQDIRQIFSYSGSYGEGGFQGRLGPLRRLLEESGFAQG